MPPTEGDGRSPVAGECLPKIYLHASHANHSSKVSPSIASITPNHEVKRNYHTHERPNNKAPSKQLFQSAKTPQSAMTNPASNIDPTFFNQPPRALWLTSCPKTHDNFTAPTKMYRRLA